MSFDYRCQSSANLGKLGPGLSATKFYKFADDMKISGSVLETCLKTLIYCFIKCLNLGCDGLNLYPSGEIHLVINNDGLIVGDFLVAKNGVSAYLPG